MADHADHKAEDPSREQGEKWRDGWDTYEQLKDYRAPFERQWYLNMAFLIGRHYVKYNPAQKRLEDAIRQELGDMTTQKTLTGRRARLVSNHVLRLFRQKWSEFVRMRPTITIQAATEDEDDIKKARLGQDVAHVLERRLAFGNLIRKLWMLLLSMGHCSLFPFWNPRLGGQIPGSTDKVRFRGDADIALLTPFETYWPRSKWTEPLKECIVVQSLDTDEVASTWGKKVSPEEDLVASPVEQQIRQLMEDRDLEKVTNMVRVLTRFKLPDSTHPNGTYQVSTKTDLLYEGEIPAWYQDADGAYILPVRKFDFQDVPMTQYPMSFIEPLISPQKEYNMKISRITDHFRKLTGKWLVPFGASLKEPISDATGQLIFYDPSAGLAPQAMSPPGLPGSIFQDLGRVKSDMEDLAASHEISHGKVPAGVKSGKAIQALKESDESQMSPMLIAVEEQMASVFLILLNMVQMNYQEPRTLSVVGKNKRYQIKDFTGEKMSGARDIIISLGSVFPFSKVARQDAVREDFKLGILTLQEARERLEVTGEVDSPRQVDVLQIKQENQDMLNGILVEVNVFDNHLMHIRDHDKVRKDPDFQRNAPAHVKMVFEAHDQVHKALALRELQAQQQVAPQGAGAPASPPGAPQGTGG